MKSAPILLKALPLAVAVSLIKNLFLQGILVQDIPLNGLLEIADIGILFTGAFFVMGLLLAGTMTDFKESEKIPGEIAANLEAIQDWILLAFKAPRTGSPERTAEPLDPAYLRLTLGSASRGIMEWFKSKEKDSRIIFPLLRKFNEIAYYFAEQGVDKEAIKGIQENTNAMRKQITRAYTISRTSFIAPAYTLLRGLLIFTILLLFIAKFKTVYADIFVPFGLSFIFVYLYFLILGLDDPFDVHSGDTEVELRPIDRFVQRLEENSMR